MSEIQSRDSEEWDKADDDSYEIGLTESKSFLSYLFSASLQLIAGLIFIAIKGWLFDDARGWGASVLPVDDGEGKSHDSNQTGE